MPHRMRPGARAGYVRAPAALLAAIPRSPARSASYAAILAAAPHIGGPPVLRRAGEYASIPNLLTTDAVILATASQAHTAGPMGYPTHDASCGGCLPPHCGLVDDRDADGIREKRGRDMPARARRHRAASPAAGCTACPH